jgi:hypothetical protein
MPRISAFYGIVIWMYYDEAHHGGRPHFHAHYGDDEATIDMESLAIIAGVCLHAGGGSLSSGHERISPSYARTGFARAAISRSFPLSRCVRRSTICGDAQHATTH